VAWGECANFWENKSVVVARGFAISTGFRGLTGFGGGDEKRTQRAQRKNAKGAEEEQTQIPFGNDKQM
jgi:hypothetical protein